MHSIVNEISVKNDSEPYFYNYFTEEKTKKINNFRTHAQHLNSLYIYLLYIHIYRQPINICNNSNKITFEISFHHFGAVFLIPNIQ